MDGLRRDFVLDLHEGDPRMTERGSPLDERSIHRTILPGSWFSEESDWKPIVARRWKIPEHISRGEARAALRSLEAACSVVLDGHCPWLELWLLGLCDNHTATAVWLRGRSAVWDLNQIQRRRAALEMLFAVRHRLGWTPTSLMPADGGTRPIGGVLRLLAPTWTSEREIILVTLEAATLCSWAREKGWIPLECTMRGGTGAAKLRHSLLTRLSTGRVSALWIEPSGYTWERRASGQPLLRNPKKLYISDVNIVQPGVIEGANHEADFISHLIIAAYEHTVPVVAMHPRASLLWAAGPMLDATRYAQLAACSVPGCRWSDQDQRSWRIVSSDDGVLRAARSHATRSSHRGDHTVDRGALGSWTCPRALAWALFDALTASGERGGRGRGGAGSDDSLAPDGSPAGGPAASRALGAEHADDLPENAAGVHTVAHAHRTGLHRRPEPRQHGGGLHSRDRAPLHGGGVHRGGR